MARVLLGLVLLAATTGVPAFTPRVTSVSPAQCLPGSFSRLARRARMPVSMKSVKGSEGEGAGTTTQKTDEIPRTTGTVKSRAVNAGRAAESNVVPFGSRTAQRPEEAGAGSGGGVVARRTALALAGGLGLWGMGSGFGGPGEDAGEETNAALKKLRARRAAKQETEAVATQDVPNGGLVEQAEEAVETVGATVQAVAAGVVRVGQGVGTLAHGVAAAGSATVQAAQTTAHALEATAEVVVGAAEMAAPVLQKGADAALPVLHDAYTKAAPYVQQAADMADPVIDAARHNMEPVMRRTGETLDELVHNPQLSQAVSDSVRGANEAVHRVTDSPQLAAAVAQTNAQLELASEAVRPAMPYVQALAHLVWGAAVWFGHFLGTVASAGQEGAKAEMLATLKHQASSGAQVAEQVVWPAAKAGAQLTLETLADLCHRALETPNGQLLEQKVASSVSDLTSQRDAVVSSPYASRCMRPPLHAPARHSAARVRAIALSLLSLRLPRPVQPSAYPRACPLALACCMSHVACLPRCLLQVREVEEGVRAQTGLVAEKASAALADIASHSSAALREASDATAHAFGDAKV